MAHLHIPRERADPALTLPSLILLALATLLLHCLTNGQYGFHRDELATLDAARRLAWGYVGYPPVAPFVARVAPELFGPSLVGLRFFSALALSVAIVLAGLMARELGGSRTAQTLDKPGTRVLAGNYGEAGAINLYGAAQGLPEAISGINSYRLRSYGDPPPQTLIVLGFSPRDLDRLFATCSLAAEISNRYGVDNEEIRDHPAIFICCDPLQRLARTVREAAAFRIAPERARARLAHAQLRLNRAA